MKYFLLLALLLALPALAPAQCYTAYRDAGKKLVQEKKYAEAIQKFEKARGCKSDKPANGDAEINTLIADAKKRMNKPAGNDNGAKPAAPTKTTKPDTRADDDAWEIAQGTLTGCRRYLDKYPRGRHSDDARRCVRDYSDDDGDGVVNKYDNCRDEPGEAADNGCPKPKPNFPQPDMVLVKAGSYTRGCTAEQSDCSSDEKPAHLVRLTRDFYLARHEVTNAQYAAFLNEKGNQTEGGAEWIDLSGAWSPASKCRIYLDGGVFRVERGYENHPVAYVSWYGARAYCTWLSAKTGRRYRLPTEAEWEYAARGGHLAPARQTLYAGSDDPDAAGWFWENSGDTRLSGSWSSDKLKSNNCGPHAAGGKKANALGLYDMSGNLWEWCGDWYGPYAEGAQTDPTGPSEGSYRVLRGGSWGGITGILRVADRLIDDPIERSDGVGFRAAQDK